MMIPNVNKQLNICVQIIKTNKECDILIFVGRFGWSIVLDIYGTHHSNQIDTSRKFDD